MRENRSVPLTAPLRRGEVCVAQGFGTRIRIEKQHLVVEDGSGRNRNMRRYARATHGLSRLVVIGSEGYVTLDAIRWLRHLGIGYLHLDRDGTILVTADNGGSDARLRRLQAHASTTAVGVEVARYLLGVKVEGQGRNLTRIPGSDGAREAIRHWQRRIEEAVAIDQLMEAEREAAAAYWGCWAGRPVKFAKRDLDGIPAHWNTVGTRHSPLSNGPRVAIAPVNAILNYLYAILEAETRIACLTVGLDPGLGIWHADYRARDSFVLDLMEAARPDVDRFVLDLIARRTLRRKDVGETSRGICRLLPPLAHELAQTARRWRLAIAPHAEYAAALLARSPGSRVDRTSTSLTQARRRTAQATRRRPGRSKEPARPYPVCKRCGGALPKRERVYCDTCFQLPQAERRIPVEGLKREPQVARAVARRCKSCGEQVMHRKRVYCDDCFAAYEERLSAMRKQCRSCGRPVPNRKRVYCDQCLEGGRPGLS